MTVGLLRLATRSSPLARLQADLVADALHLAYPAIGIEIIATDTLGDRQIEVPLDQIAGRGIFANEIDAIVASGHADVAVHSAKDLPSTEGPEAPVICAVLPRADVRDVLVGGRLEELPPGSAIATSAPRRRVQLAAIRPDLGFLPLRGNIATRLDKIPPNGAVVVALAALERLGRADLAAETLSILDCLPQVGQGVIALRCHASAAAVHAVVGAIDDVPTHRALDAERAFLRRLGGGCDAPVGAYAIADGLFGTIRLAAMIASSDGHVILRRNLKGTDPEMVGLELAEAMLEFDGALKIVALES
jgi:hydroxymethylbilane synthase